MESIRENKIKFLSAAKKWMTGTGDFILFTTKFFKELVRRPIEWKETIYQCYKSGYTSLSLVGVTAFIMGLVLTLQSRPSLAVFGADSLLPGMVSVSVVREIGPVITALICAGKIGSRMGAELGAMRVTEQIDAMEVSAINPYKYLVVTRVTSTILMVPLLVIMADAISLFASYIAVNIHGDVTLLHFYSQAMGKLSFMDVVPALIKSVFFGFAIGMIGCYKGFTAAYGTASVGKAANSAVIASSLSIFIIDMITVQVTDLL